MLNPFVTPPNLITHFYLLYKQNQSPFSQYFQSHIVSGMNAQITEDQINRQLDQLKEFETSAKKEILKKVEVNGKQYKEEFELNYSDFMYINSVFGNQRALDQLVREVFPSMKFKHKQEEKKLLRHIGKVFLQQLVQMSVLAKDSSGKESLDADCIREGYRRFQQTHAPIRKNKGYRRLI